MNFIIAIIYYCYFILRCCYWLQQHNYNNNPATLQQLVQSNSVITSWKNILCCYTRVLL